MQTRFPAALSEVLSGLCVIRVATICQVGIFVKFLNSLLLIHQTQTQEDLSGFMRTNDLLEGSAH